MIKLWITVLSLTNYSDIKYEMGENITHLGDQKEWIIEDLNQGNLSKEKTLELMLEWENLDVEQDILIKYYNIYFTN